MASREILGFRDRTSYSSEMPAPISYVMGRGVYGSYDGLKLRPPGVSTWRRFPNNAPMVKNPIFVPQHSGGPLANEVVPVNIPDNSMFFFAKNVSSPYCCPATYSSDQGCVCTTPWQRDYIGVERGGNKRFWCSDPDF